MSTALHISVTLLIKTWYVFIWNQFNPKWKGKHEVLVNIINTTGCSIIIIDFIKAIVILTKRAFFFFSRSGQVKSISFSHSNINMACAFLYLAILRSRG